MSRRSVRARGTRVSTTDGLRITHPPPLTPPRRKRGEGKSNCVASLTGNTIVSGTVAPASPSRGGRTQRCTVNDRHESTAISGMVGPLARERRIELLTEADVLIVEIADAEFEHAVG